MSMSISLSMSVSVSISMSMSMSMSISISISISISMSMSMSMRLLIYVMSSIYHDITVLIAAIYFSMYQHIGSRQNHSKNPLMKASRLPWLRCPSSQK
mgnify:FL=1